MLPAPIIEGTIPAFYKDGTMAKVVVPFTMSRAVNRNEINGFVLKFKGLKGSNMLFDVSSTAIDYVKSIVIFTLNTKQLGLLSIGQFYKVQLAYYQTMGEKNQEGYYSTVGIIKYTSKPTVTIANLLSTKNNAHTYTYTGEYIQTSDKTEKLYSYRFILKNNLNEVIYDSDYLIHNASFDNAETGVAIDNFTYSYDLVSNEKYTITYMIKTNNGLEISSPSYKIMQRELISTSSIEKIFAEVDDENGFVGIRFNVHPNPITDYDKQLAEIDAANEQKVTGSFVLTRASEDSQYKNWETIVKFSLYSQKPSSQSWKDFTVEHGKKYKYSIQQYSKINNLYSNRVITEPVIVKFEHSFLYDGKRQLKIKFNPKVSSFKKNLAEGKIDTIGGKYPFIFKNGIVEYKEFPISGLISYFMDEQSFFGAKLPRFSKEERESIAIYEPFNWKSSSDPSIDISLKRAQYKDMYRYFYIFDDVSQKYIRWVEYLDNQYWNDIDLKFSKYKNYDNYDNYYDSTKIYYTRVLQDIDTASSILDEIYTTNLTSNNISLERDFKMEVLDWLTNGEIKLFRSPTEGNFIVRLMNVSLTPNEQLGRMLHSFQATAYEVDTCNYNTLQFYNFINTSSFKKSYFKVKTIKLSINPENNTNSNMEIFLNNITYNTKNNIYYAEGSLMPQTDRLEFIEIENVYNHNGQNEPIIFEINGEQIFIQNVQNKGGYLKLEMPIYSFSIVGNPKLSGSVHMGYFTDIDDTFNYLQNIEIEEICGRQFTTDEEEALDIIPQLSTILNINDTAIEKVSEPFHYHLIRNWKKTEQIEEHPLSYQIQITYKNGITDIIDLTDDIYYEIQDIDNISSYIINNGIKCDFTYSIQTKVYTINSAIDKQNVLLNSKRKLDVYNEILAYETAKHYKNINQLDNYIEMLKVIQGKQSFEEQALIYNDIQINDSYNNVYNQYIEELRNYLLSIFSYNNEQAEGG